MKPYGAIDRTTLGNEDVLGKMLRNIKRSTSWRRDINAYLRGKARQRVKKELRKLQEDLCASQASAEHS